MNPSAELGGWRIAGYDADEKTNRTRNGGKTGGFSASLITRPDVSIISVTGHQGDVVTGKHRRAPSVIGTCRGTFVFAVPHRAPLSHAYRRNLLSLVAELPRGISVSTSVFARRRRISATHRPVLRRPIIVYGFSIVNVRKRRLYIINLRACVYVARRTT